MTMEKWEKTILSLLMAGDPTVVVLETMDVIFPLSNGEILCLRHPL
jgi:hypothetical protein